MDPPAETAQSRPIPSVRSIVASTGAVPQKVRGVLLYDKQNRLLDACCATRYVRSVIQSFRHRGLQRFYETGRRAGIQTRHAPRLRLQLAALDTAQTIDDMDIPGYRLHRLKGKLKSRWAIRVSGNWRLTFEFAGGDIHVLDYEDYHS